MSGAVNIPLTLSERYRLERELGHGAMGYVYLARDLKHGREVAVKVLTPATAHALDSERFLAEVRTAAGLNHPHILTVHESGEADGRLYYVMPRVEGSSLRDLLERKPRLPLTQAVDIARQVSEGLSYAHARGIVHRDIKPGNILVGATGHVYIADFGLALAMSSVSSVRRTAAGIAVGSPLYMSPEQAAGEADVDARSDIYSLGCVLFEMLAGAPPFPGTDARQVLSHHVMTSPPLLRARRADVPRDLEGAVQKALAKDPADRYTTAEQFCRDLERHGPDASSSSRDLDPGETGAPPALAGDAAGESSNLAAAVRRLRRRPAAKWLLAYLAIGALLLLGGPAVTRQLGGSPAALRVALLLFGAGALALALIPWLTARRGRPPPHRLETTLLLVFSFCGVLAAGAMVVAGWDDAGSMGPLAAADVRLTDGPPSMGDLDPRRVAVLYFDERSTDDDTGYLAAAFTEELIDALTGVEGLEVLSKHAVAPFREGSVPLEEIVRTLGAGTVVSGAVRQEGDRIHVSIQLVEGESGTQRWRTTFERSSGELLAAQDQLVGEVARALRSRLGYEFELRTSRQEASSDAAWRLVRKGDELVRTLTVRQLPMHDPDAAERFAHRADSLYTEAEHLDPLWAEPTLRRAEVAELRSRLHRPASDRRSPEYLEHGIALATAILARDSVYAPALEMRGRLRYHLAESTVGPEAERLLVAASADLERSVALRPSLAIGWWTLSRVRWRQGWFAEAAAAAERAFEADAFLEMPEEVLFQLYNTAFAQERLDEAIRWCDIGRQRHPDALHFVLCRLYLLASVDSLTPDIDHGWDLVDSLTARASGLRRDDYRILGQLQVAKIAVQVGRPDSARAILRRIASAHQGIPDLATYDAAHAYLLLGERAEALRLLRRWVEYGGPQKAASLARDWWFRSLRGDSAFDALVGQSMADR